MFVLQIVNETGTSPELVLCPLSPTHQGHYICRINHGEKCLFSQWAHVRLVKSTGSSAGICPIRSLCFSLLPVHLMI